MMLRINCALMGIFIVLSCGPTQTSKQKPVSSKTATTTATEPEGPIQETPPPSSGNAAGYQNPKTIETPFDTMKEQDYSQFGKPPDGFGDEVPGSSNGSTSAPTSEESSKPIEN